MARLAKFKRLETEKKKQKSKHRNGTEKDEFIASFSTRPRDFTVHFSSSLVDYRIQP